MRKHGVMTGLVALLASGALVASGCSRESPHLEPTALAELAVSVDATVEGNVVRYELSPTPAGDGLEGWVHTTTPDGNQTSEWVTLPVMESAAHFTFFEEAGRTYFGDPLSDVKIPVLELQEEPDRVLAVLQGANGQTATVEISASGDQPQFVCGGLCIAALLAGGVLALCGLAVVLLIINCNRQGKCWEVELLKFDPNDFAICKGRCIAWES
jgi:hypothetical protein